MNPNHALSLLGGLTPAQFMRRHWQKKPLLVRQACPEPGAVMDRRDLFALAARDEVESRLVLREGRGWQLRHGPFARRALPPLAERNWSLLVQGVDLHHEPAHQLMRQFAFVPEARLDDLMVSFATPGGGVGPHVDSYDVFLLQVKGRRRWRIAARPDARLRNGLPLKILARFEPQETFVLEPGDMLYLPPGYAHDGVALDECMTCSIGFRAPAARELGAELLLRAAEQADEASDEAVSLDLYRDPQQDATARPGAIPVRLQTFALQAVRRFAAQPALLRRSLGEFLSEPKPGVVFEPGHASAGLKALRLDRRTRMMYDARTIYVNGESWHAGGADAVLMRRLADRRALDARSVQAASADARALLQSWCEAGWAHGE